jgi:hypothetical protein
VYRADQVKCMGYLFNKLKNNSSYHVYWENGQYCAHEMWHEVANPVQHKCVLYRIITK